MLEVWKCGSNVCEIDTLDEVTAHEGCERDVVHEMSEGYRAW